MSVPLPRSARAALAGLVMLAAWVIADPPGSSDRLALGIACALPLLLLTATGIRPSRTWGGWVAVVMVPYVTLAVGAALLPVEDRAAAAAFAALTVLVFFLGIDAGRKLGAFRRDAGALRD